MPLAQLRRRPSNDEHTRPSTSRATSTASENEEVTRKVTNIVWQNCRPADPPNFDFTPEFTTGLKSIYQGILADADPLDYFELFLTDDILTIIVDQTNLYATQELIGGNDISAGSRNHAWAPTNKEEMMIFLALVGWMGLVKLPAIRDYWRNDELYGIPLARKIMPRNRFELMLKFIHFSDNSEAPPDDRLHKLRLVINLFTTFNKHILQAKEYALMKALYPGEVACCSGNTSLTSVTNTG